MLSLTKGYSQKLTLGDCIKYALNNNLLVKNKQLQTAISNEDYKQSYRDLLPGLGGSLGGGNSYGKSIDPTSDSFVDTKFFSANYGLSSSITLFNGFKKINTITYRKWVKEQSYENERLERILLAYDVMSAYYDVIYFKGLLKIAEEQVMVSEMKLKQSKRMIDVGLSAETELLETKAALAREELSKIQMSNNVDLSILKLKRVMNFEATDDLQIVTDVDVVVNMDGEFDVDDVYAMTEQFYPTIRSAELSLKLAKKSLAINRGNFYPSLSMSGGYGSRYSDSNGASLKDQLKANTSQSLRFGINVPIFSKWATRSSVKRSKLRLLIAQNELDNTRRLRYLKVVEDVQQLRSLSKEYHQSKRSLDVQQQAFKVADKKLHEGLITTVEYNSAKLDVANAKSNTLRVQTQYAIKKHTISLYCGTSLFELNF